MNPKSRVASNLLRETGDLTREFRNATIHIEPTPRRVRSVFAGVTVADSRSAIVLRSVGSRRGTPVYYFPAQDVRLDLLRTTEMKLDDPDLGTASVFDIEACGRVSPAAAFSFSDGVSLDHAPDLRGYVAFRWDRLDSWFEEDEEVFQHARDPYVRIDCLQSSRHVRVVLGGEEVADTHRPVLLFETSLITRFYLPKLNVRMDLLRRSDTLTLCPYKGRASYYSMEVGGRFYKDVAWYYPQATPQASSIAGSYVAFFEEKVDFFEVDGVRRPTPDSHFARDAY